MTVCISFNLYLITVIYKRVDRNLCWQSTYVNQETINYDISKKSFGTNTYFFAIFLLSCTSVLYTFVSAYDDKIDFDIMWIHRYVPSMLQNFLFVPFKIFRLFAGYIVQVPICQMAYLMQHNRYRIIFLLHHIKNINTNYESFQLEKLLFDSSYQKVVKERLIFCINHHIDILTYMKESSKQASVFIFLFSVSGILLFISLLLNILLVSCLL